MTQEQGWVLLLTGIVIRYIIGRRKFYRRGLGGLQHFSSYIMALLITVLEWVFKWLANLMMLSGLLKLAFS